MRYTIAIGTMLNLMIITTYAHADCICVQPKYDEIVCFTVVPGPPCTRGINNRDGQSIDLDTPDDVPTIGGGGRGGNLSIAPERDLENFRIKMQEQQGPMMGTNVN